MRGNYYMGHKEKQYNLTRRGTRTRNLPLWTEAPYQLVHTSKTSSSVPISHTDREQKTISKISILLPIFSEIKSRLASLYAHYSMPIRSSQLLVARKSHCGRDDTGSRPVVGNLHFIIFSHTTPIHRSSDIQPSFANAF